MGVFILLLIFLILILLLEKIINKLFGIKVKGKISETSGKNIDRWGRVIIVVIFLCSLPFFEGTLPKWHYMLFWTSLWGFQAILEWKYLRSSKQYVVTLAYLILLVVFIYNIEYFLKIIQDI